MKASKESVLCVESLTTVPCSWAPRAVVTTIVSGGGEAVRRAQAESVNIYRSSMRVHLQGAAGIGQGRGVVIDLYASVGSLLVYATLCAALGEGSSRRYGMV